MEGEDFVYSCDQISHVSDARPDVRHGPQPLPLHQRARCEAEEIVLFAGAEGVQGGPDGMKVDVKGNLYVTGPGGVWVYDARGQRLGVIVTPEVPANCGFGDPDAKTLYITARTGLYRVRLSVAGVK